MKLIALITRTSWAVVLRTLIQPTLHQHLIISTSLQLPSKKERLSFPRSARVRVELEEPFRRYEH
jgi:hypothetical protein